MTHQGTKLLADCPAHAQALKLSRDGWRVVLSLPLVCEDLGEECPEWAWGLCEHAAAVTDGSPAELLEALTRAAVVAEDEVTITSELAELGVSLDLCEVLGSNDEGTVRIQPTAFGHVAVMLLSQAEDEGWPHGD